MKATPPANNAGSLAAWLTDPRTAEYFGESWAFKADILEAVIRGEKLAPIARQHGVTRSAASKQAGRARAIFGDLKLTPGHV